MSSKDRRCSSDSVFFWKHHPPAIWPQPQESSQHRYVWYFSKRYSDYSPWKAIPTFVIGVITYLFFLLPFTPLSFKKFFSLSYFFFFSFLGLFFLLLILPFLFSFSSYPYPHLQGHLPSLPKHSAQFPELWLQGHLQPAYHNHRQALYKLALSGWNAQGPTG